MWGRNSKKTRDDDIVAAKKEQAKVAKLQEDVDAIQPEVEDRVSRLERRIKRNNFVPSLYEALGRREAEVKRG